MSQPLGALAGVKVLDLSRWIAGPFCTMLLADLGADVIRVERPGGEDARHLPPFVGEESAYYLHYNRNKRAITLSTRHPASGGILRSLLAWADVVVQNFRPGTMEEMGLGAEELDAINPRLIVTAISGYGQTGPWSRRPLFNAIAEAVGGLMALNGSGGVPLMTGNFASDHSAGLHAALATVSALYERESSGRGQLVDVALFDSTMSVLGFPLTAALNDEPGVGIRQDANRDKTAAPGNIFPCGDGRYVYIDAGTDGLFGALLDAMGPDSPARAESFSTVESRGEHVDELEALISDWTGSMPAEAVSAALESTGVPHGIVQTVGEVAEHPLLRERGLVASSSEGAHEVRFPGPPIKLSRTPASVRRPPPATGQDTDEVLTDVCGFSADEVARLRADGAI